MVMSVDVVSRARGRKIALRRVKQTARKILTLLDQGDAELSVALVANEEIKKLNGKYRNQPKPTDVLSFSVDGLPGGRARLLGDVVISVEKAEEQANDGGWTLEEEIERL